MKSLLHTKDLGIGHDGKVLLDKVRIDLHGGELVALLGVNGIGKSTLIRTLGGLLPPLGGRVDLLGDDLASLAAQDRARRIALVLTGRPRVGMLSVRSLVALGRQPWTGLFGTLSVKDHALVDEAMEHVGLSALADRSVEELSDGECQKVMLACALAQGTPVLLLDEPTAFLDLPNRVQLLQLLRSVCSELGRAVLFSTHDLELALQLCDRIVLVGRDRTVWQGTTAAAVAEGRLSREFDGPGVRFDPSDRSFRIDR